MRSTYGPRPSIYVVVLLGGPLLAGGALCLGEQVATTEPVCVLGWPGVADRFVLFADGSGQSTTTRARVSGSIDLATDRGLDGGSAPTLSWMAPGTRVVRTARDFDGLELVSLTAADLYGRPAPSLWLFRAMTITNSRPEARSCRLTVRVAWGEDQHDLALRRESILTDSGRVVVAASRKAANLEVAADSREALLTFDLDVPREAPVEFLIAAPAVPEVYDEADAPDVSRLQPSELIDRIAARWRQKVLPETLTVGSPLVTQAFHAAVSSLILFPPGEEAPATEAAAWMSGLAGARQGSAASEFVESLVTKQRSGAGLAAPGDVIGQADLTTALADYARHADDPGRMCRLLWATVSAAAADLSARAAGTANAGTRVRAGLALREAANVADVIGQGAEAGAWRQQAEAFLAEADASQAAVHLADPFSSRAYAAVVAAQPAAAIPSVAEAELSAAGRLARAHVALLAGTREGRLLAWQVVEDTLRAHPLPGVFTHDGTEDILAAAQLIALVSDAICQSGAGELHLFPALPIGWAHDGLLLELARFPSGIGPLDLEASSRRAQVTVEPLALPKSAADIGVHPPLGVETVEVGVNGRRLKGEAFQGGPPWKLDPKTRKVVMRFARAPGE